MYCQNLILEMYQNSAAALDDDEPTSLRPQQQEQHNDHESQHRYSEFI